MHRIGLFLLVAGCLWLAQGSRTLAQEEKKIVKTASGLQYEELKEGTGPAAKAGDTVQRSTTPGRWRPTARNSDSSLDRGKPLEFELGAREGHQGLEMKASPASRSAAKPPASSFPQPWAMGASEPAA